MCAQSCPALFRPQATLFVARQTPLSMGFPSQEYWSGLPCPPPGDLPDPGIEPTAPAWAGGSLSTQPLGSPHLCRHEVKLKYGSRGSVERDFAIAVVTGAPRSPACLPETQTQNVGSEPPMFPLPDPGLPPNPISGLPLGPWRRSGTDS